MQKQANKQPLLQIEELWAGFPNKPVLKGASLSIEKGQIYGLLGVNGAGKSTLMRTMLGVLTPQKGYIKWNTHSSQRLIGGVIETPRLYPHLSIQKHLAIFAAYHQIPIDEASIWLDTVGLYEQRHIKAGQCSWGMRQRLALALTLLPQPQLIILDEPSNGLDPSGQKELYRTIKLLSHSKEIAFLIASHHFEELEEMADKVGILHGGKICWEGTLKEAPQSVIFTFRKKASSLVQRLLSEKNVRFEWLDHEKARVQVKLPSDISTLSRHFVMHGIALMGIEPQNPSLAEIYWKHTETLVA